MSSHPGFVAIGILAAMYFLPTIVATCRLAKFGNSVFWINLLFGWTFIGWFVALIMACCSERMPDYILRMNSYRAAVGKPPKAPIGWGHKIPKPDPEWVEPGKLSNFFWKVV